MTFNHEKRNQFLWLAAMGQKMFVERRFAESNSFFESAYLMRIDHISKEINDKTDYYKYDHTLSMVLYFKILNYLNLGQVDEALVECRRLDDLFLTFKHHQDFSEKDPLLHLIVGLTYELDGEYDNALVSYRKAQELYELLYKDSFSKQAPHQLVTDIRKLVDRVELNSKQRDNNFGELIFIWHNGQQPIRINYFEKYRVYYHEGEMKASAELAFPEVDCIGNLLLPFYKIKQPYFFSGILKTEETQLSFDLIEDETWYFVKTLQDRLHTEGIHTWKPGRDWSTLPYSVSYVRVPLHAGVNHFEFVAKGFGGTIKTQSFNCEGNGKRNIRVFTSLDSYNP
jgi:tetratricopeptide (TPR) repeat protein